MTPRFARNDLEVRWLEGGLYVEASGEGLVIDVPVGAVPALGAWGVLGRIHSVLLTSGRRQSVEGLVSLLCALEPHRRTEVPLGLRTLLGEERGERLANAWVQAWPARYPLMMDGVSAGETFATGALEVRTIRVPHGEPRWGEEPVVEPAIGVAVRVRARGLVVAWVPGAAPSRATRRACEGADLAVIEVGVEPWPSADRPWRLTPETALQAATGADEVWLVGDDGRFGLPGGRQPT